MISIKASPETWEFPRLDSVVEKTEVGEGSRYENPQNLVLGPRSIHLHEGAKAIGDSSLVNIISVKKLES